MSPPPPTPEDGNRSSFRNVEVSKFFGIPDDGYSPKANQFWLSISIVRTLQNLHVSMAMNFLFNFPLYLQSVPVHSANVVKSYIKACRRVLTSILLYLIGPQSFCDLKSVTYKLILKFTYLQLHPESCRQIFWQVFSQSSCFWWLLKVSN
jgi:hypothetical protein